MTLLLVLLSSFEEILLRSTMEWKEVKLRKLLGHPALTEQQLEQKRKYWSYSITMGSIVELISIVLSAVMFVAFSSNRYTVDLGYEGINEVDVAAVIFTVVFQIVIEMIVDIICAFIEQRKGLPLSDFFFQYR